MKQSKKADTKRKKRQDVEHQLKKKCCELIGGDWVKWGRRWFCIGNCPVCGETSNLELSHEPPKGMGGTTREYSTDEYAENQVMLRCHKCHGAYHGEVIR